MSDGRIVFVDTPAGDQLAFHHMEGVDAVNSAFEFKVHMVSEDFDVDPSTILGESICVHFSEELDWPCFDGLVSDFSLIRQERGFAVYCATIRPWFWFLSLQWDCRIFQAMNVIEIVEKVFSRHPKAKYEIKTNGTFSTREYCVQYDESDFDFVQRLLAQEGVSYYFVHEDKQHTMILCDDASPFQTAEGLAEIPFHIPGERLAQSPSYFDHWVPRNSVRPGTYTHSDYDFKAPKKDLLSKSDMPLQHGLNKLEVYRHPGDHKVDSTDDKDRTADRGTAVADIRLEALQGTHARVECSGHVQGLRCGNVFTPRGVPGKNQEEEQLVVGAHYSIWNPTYRTGTEVEEVFQFSCEAMPTRLPLRPVCDVGKRVMRGPQTATVTGPAGEEIYPDKWGRVKVHFHGWDRLLSDNEEESSCWVRVSTAWAGTQFGFVQIPRIGQEVIVDFIEGDADRPIITGRVYNNDQMPPYELPGNKTQSGWKSKSSPNSAGFNELRFEDKAGEEEVYFQAEKDNTILVKNDRNELVQHDEGVRIDNNATHSVGVNLDEDVGNNKTTKVGVNRTTNIGSEEVLTVGASRLQTVDVNERISIGANQDIGIGANQTEQIGANQSVNIGANQTIGVAIARSDTVGAAETKSIGAAQMLTVGAARQVSVGAMQSHTIGASDSWNVSGNRSTSIGGNNTLGIDGNDSTNVKKDQSVDVDGSRALKIKKSQQHEVSENVGIKVGKNLMIEAGDVITLKCGSAAIAMKKDGTINIEGKDITIKGSGKINVKANGEITMEGSKINQN